MPRFNARYPCPNCNGGTHLPQGRGIRCHGISFDDYFICTREEQSEDCREVETGFLHAYVNCFCGKAHDGTQAKVSDQTAPSSNKYKEYAEDIWTQTIDPEGTDTQDYLRNRGIEILVDQVRHHNALTHTPTGLYCEAMVARISDPSNKFMGIERHYIDGGTKAFDTQNKMILGALKGGSVKLSKLDGSGVLGVAEGVVTSMTLVQELGTPVWACLGASNIPHLKLPPLEIIHTVKVYTDGDADGEKARDRAGDLWLKQGYKVINCQAPEGIDYNDVLHEGLLI